jgi:hypothetical protein
MKMKGTVMQELPEWEMGRPAGPAASSDGFRRVFTLDVDAAGKVSGTVAVELTGDSGETYARAYKDEAPAAQRRRLEGILSWTFPGGRLNSFEEDLGSGTSRPVRYLLRFESDRATATAPGEVLLPLDFLSSVRERQPWPEKRTQNLVIRDPEALQDTVEVRGPKGWDLRMEPQEGRQEGEVATSEFRLAAAEGTVRATRSLSIRRGNWSVEKYPDVPRAITLLSRLKHAAVRWVDPHPVTQVGTPVESTSRTPARSPGGKAPRRATPGAPTSRP